MRVMVFSRWAGVGVLSASLLPAAASAQGARRIALAKGLAIAHTDRGVGGERESVTAVDEATAAGVRYSWSDREISTRGDTATGRAGRFVSATDLAAAARMHLIYDPKGPAEHPGYTAWSVSSSVYQQLRGSGTAPFQIMTGEWAGGAMPGLSSGGPQLIPSRWRGTLTRVGGGPESFPLLVDGRRVSVPALRARADFTARGEKWTPELWVLADSAHP